MSTNNSELAVMVTGYLAVAELCKGMQQAAELAAKVNVVIPPAKVMYRGELMTVTAALGFNLLSDMMTAAHIEQAEIPATVFRATAVIGLYLAAVAKGSSAKGIKTAETNDIKADKMLVHRQQSLSKFAK